MRKGRQALACKGKLLSFFVAFHLLRARRDHFAPIRILTYLVLKKFSLCQLCSDYSTLLRHSFIVLISTDIHKEGRKKNFD